MITLAQAQAKLQLWLDAEEALAAGQKVAMEGRTLERADLAEVAKRVSYWDLKCKRLSASRGARIGRVVGHRG